MSEKPAIPSPPPPEPSPELDALERELPGGEGEAAPGLEAGPPPPDPSEIPTAHILLPALQVTLNTWAPAWGLSPEELRQLAAAWGAVLDKYLPPGWTLGVEVQAVLVTAAVFGPRLGTPRRQGAARPVEDSEEAPARAGGKFDPLPDA